MRKRTCNNLFDNILWYSIYLLPIIMTLVIIGGGFQGDWYAAWQDVDGDFSSFPFYVVFSSVLDVSFEVIGFSAICQSLESIFSTEGLLPFFVANSVVFRYFSYLVGVYLIHLFIDFILFIPRLAHKWLNAFTRSDD